MSENNDLSPIDEAKMAGLRRTHATLENDLLRRENDRLRQEIEQMRRCITE
jgi:hypothetical protein